MTEPEPLPSPMKPQSEDGGTAVPRVEAPRRLKGRTIFMSASVPAPERAERFRRVEHAALEIEQAVVSLTRAVLSEGGTLVFGGHPAISPLVATVAGEYREARFAESGKEGPEPQVQIYQSELFREVAPEATMLMFRLGLARVHWIGRDPDEHFGESPASGPRFPRSLERMRTTMILDSRPDCMVCIGGMEGILDELELFWRIWPEQRCYALRSTGGASALLADTFPAAAASGHLDIVDDRIMARMREREARRGAIDDDAKGRQAIDPRRAEIAASIIPYPLIMQTIVAELAGEKGD